MRRVNANPRGRVVVVALVEREREAAGGISSCRAAVAQQPPTS